MITKFEFNAKDITSIIEALNKASPENVTSIRIHNCNFEGIHSAQIDKAKELQNILKKFTELQEFAFTGAQPRTVSLTHIVKGLPQNLKALTLAKCSIFNDSPTEEEKTAFCKAFRRFKNLERLDLSGNSNLGERLASIIESMTNLNYLDIGLSGIVAASYKKLGGALSKLSKLRSFYINLNNLSSSLGDLLQQCPEELEELDISNCLTPVECYPSVNAALSRFKKMVTLTADPGLDTVLAIEPAPLSDDSYTPSDKARAAHAPSVLVPNNASPQTLHAANPLVTKPVTKAKAAPYSSSAIGLVMVLGFTATIALVVYPEETKEFFNENFAKLADLVDKLKQQVIGA